MKGNEWNGPFFKVYSNVTAKFVYNIPKYECLDCDYSTLAITETEKYFGQVKNG